MRQSSLLEQSRLDLPTIADLDLNLDSRDEMVLVLAGLQALYADDESRCAVLAAVAADVHATRSARRGRRGFDHWSITVLAAVRLARDADYDELQDLAENHRLLRQAMGIGDWESARCLPAERIRDNVGLLSPSTVELISQRIVALGHRWKPEAAKHLRVDSFVMPTNIHWPQDVVQVGDGLRVLIRLGARLCARIGSTTLRQHRHLERERRRLLLYWHRSRNSRRGNREVALRARSGDVLDFAQERLAQIASVLDQGRAAVAQLNEKCARTAQRLIDKIAAMSVLTQQAAAVARRFAVHGEKVPVAEKLFSVFEPHTELIHRGKIPQPIEFGHRCLIVEDAAGFTVHGEVMARGTQDRERAVPIIAALGERFGKDIAISFDRGFHSPANQTDSTGLIATPCIPTTGTHAANAQDAAADAAWHRSRRRHAGVESAIGALQSGNGMIRCRDRGEIGYARYLQLGILARNLMVLGRLAIARIDAKVTAARDRRAA